ncbi:MAG: hypothetical protein PHX04_06385 [Bacilli bacterium]|nr:hypothetical protein [Bacilli bacterium]
MEICRRTDEICLIENGVTEPIETYNFSKEINFEGLMKFLLGKSLKEKVDLVNTIDNPSSEETNLIKVIGSLIKSYNTKVDELEKFKIE